MLLVVYRTLGHVDLMQKMNALTQRVQKYSSYLEMEETALDDVGIIVYLLLTHLLILIHSVTHVHTDVLS